MNRLAKLKIVLVVALLVAVVCTLMIGGPRNAVLYLKGQRLFLTNEVVDLGSVPVGKVETVDMQFRNFAVRDAVLVGVKASCGCVTVKNEFPVRVAPGELVALEVDLEASRIESSKFRITLAPVLQTFDERLPTLEIYYSTP